MSRLRGYGSPEDVEAGEFLFRPGDTVYDMMFIDTAAVDIVFESPQGEDDVVITHHGPGRFIGELNLLTGEVIYLTARVVSPGRVYRIGSEHFRRLMTEDSELSDIILSAFRARRERLKKMASHSLEIIGDTASAGAFALRSYVYRLDLPHAWFDEDSEAGSALTRPTLLSAGAGAGPARRPRRRPGHGRVTGLGTV